MSNNRGTITLLQISPARGEAMQSKPSVRAITGLGLEGDSHAKKGSSRQVLFIDEETLEGFGLSGGQVRENITTRGIALYSMTPGTRLRAGSAVFEITKDCTPCEFIEDIRPGLREKMEGHRGMLARVIEGGELRVGDSVEVVE